MKVFKILTLFIAICLLVSCSGSNEIDEEKQIILEDYDAFFDGYDGCFVIYNQSTNEYSVFNEEMAETRVSPCSTFKIYNSLIGLESGVILNDEYKYEWDGIEYPYEVWNKDHTLRTAVENSVVWYFERLASEVGQEKMKQYIEKLAYGNQDISGWTKFWLQSSLLISPKEQVLLLKDLYNGELSFSETNTEMVKDIIILEETDDYVLSGKTGAGDGINAWFIGALERDEDMYYFATNISAESNANGFVAKEITLEILSELGLY